MPSTLTARSTRLDVDSLRDLAAVALDRLAREQDAAVARWQREPAVAAALVKALATSRGEAAREMGRLLAALPHQSAERDAAWAHSARLRSTAALSSAELRAMAAAVRGVQS